MNPVDSGVASSKVTGVQFAKIFRAICSFGFCFDIIMQFVIKIKGRYGAWIAVKITQNTVMN